MAEKIYVARVTANALAAGRFVAMVAGEPVELSAAEADELLKVAFVVKATKGKKADTGGEVDNDEADEYESENSEVQTASLAPDRTATGTAQNAKSRKGNGL